MPSLLTMNDERGRLCCASDDPTKFCPDCKARLRRGRTNNMLIANSKVDLCDDAMAATDRANLSTSKAEDTEDPADHDAAMKKHMDAAHKHEEASDERDGEGATPHSIMAKSHRAQAKRHADSRDYLLNDTDTDLDDSDALPETVQNQNPKRRMKMPTRQLITNKQAEETLAYYRTQNIGSKAYEAIRKKVRAQQGMTANCSCSDEAMIPRTMSEVLGIAPPTCHSVARPGEFNAGGVSENGDPSVMLPITINYANQPSFAGHTGHDMKAADKGYLFRGGKASGQDMRSIPGFDYPDGNTGGFATEGVRDIPPLTSGRQRVKPSVPATSRSPYEGQDTASYPLQGVTGDQGSSDSAGDDYEDGRGSRSGRGKPSGGYGPDQFVAPPVEDRTEGQRGVFRQNGKSMYSEDFFGRTTPGEIGRGANPLPQDASGQSYTRSPSQDADENRRRFGNQGAPRLTGNVRDEDLLIPPTIDMAERSAEWSRKGR